ncbi:hypothetical protein [Mesorhizobium sp. 2RAF21]|uniref:hypothetical protein n=1 Tax=Mesorhizobium sp. 2RAF21 TaxID=3232995 RepID=UPI003F98153B
MALADLEAELPPKVPIPEPLRRRAAVHEAGHAIVGLVLGAGELLAVSIVDAIDPSKGEVQDGGGAFFRAAKLPERTRADFLDRIAVALAGLAAEELLLGSRAAGSGGSPGSDLHSATLSALMFEASYGLGESLAYLASAEEADLFSAMRFDRYLQQRVDKVLSEQFDRAKRILEQQRQETERVAEALLNRGRLSADEMKEIVAQQPRLKLVVGDDEKADRKTRA